MKLESEDELDHYHICHMCHTLNKDKPIKDGSSACCFECGGILYRYDSKRIDHGLALSITGFIFFVLANVFPLVKMDILGSEQFITIPKTIFSLFDNGFYLVGLLCAFLIFIFPLMIFFVNMVLFLLLKLGVGKIVTKDLLILLSHITPWSMTDIFFISILVALVKLVAFGQIHIGIAFWALMVFVLIDVYITKSITISEIWMLRKKLLLKDDIK